MVFVHMTPLKSVFISRALPLITYASSGGGGVNCNAYKCVQGGRGGSDHDQNTHFVRSFIKNATMFEPYLIGDISG